MNVRPIFEVTLEGTAYWTDITEDVLLGFSGTYGIVGNGPLDSIARSGNCQFRMRNDARPGKPLGYYSPGHANVRAGWTFGIPFRLRFIADLTISNYSTVVLASHPAAYYRLGELSGTVAADSSGYGLNGVYTGGYTLGVTGAVIDSKAVTLNGTTGYVACPQVIPEVYADPLAWAVVAECWVKFTSSNGPFVTQNTAKWTTSNGFGIGCVLDKIKMIARNAGGSIISLATALSYNDGAWHHVVGRLTPSVGYIYVDGVQVATSATSQTDPPDSNGTLVIGSDHGGISQVFFDGSIDEVSIYTSDISALDIANHYAAGVTLSFMRFRGRIADILPDSGQYGRLQVAVTAYDILRDLAETDVREVDIQINKTETETIAAILDALPSQSQPIARDFDAGVDTFPYALANVGNSTKALSAIADVVRSSFALVASKGDGTLIVRSRTSRTSGVNTFIFDNDQLDTTVPSDRSGVYNLVRATAHPQNIDGAPTTVLFALTGTPPVVNPGETITIWGVFNDPANAQRLIGGTDIQAMSSGTDYAGNSVADGSGSNQTANLSVVATTFATTVKFAVTNNGGVPIYLIPTGGSDPLLQIRGRGVYDRGPQTYQKYGAQGYGTRPVDVDMPYQADGFVAQAVADYVYAVYNDLKRQLSGVSFCANDSEEKMLLALTAEPGDQILITETVTGLTDVESIIQSLAFSYNEGMLIYKFGLARANPFQFWQWGVVGLSEWGISTRYGF